MSRQIDPFREAEASMICPECEETYSFNKEDMGVGFDCLGCGYRFTAKEERAAVRSAETVRTLTSYHFSLGDSSVGPVGFCARVMAYSPEAALAMLRAALPEIVDAAEGCTNEEGAVPHVEYIQVYFNSRAVTLSDISPGE